MKEKVLIVEDQFIEANNLEMILVRAGYSVCGIARSVQVALQILEIEQPTLVLLDIFLQGPLTGIDLAKTLREKNIAFIYLSANSNKETLEAAKATYPYGFLVKPFREKDVLVMLEIAHYRHEHSLDALQKQSTEPQLKLKSTATETEASPKPTLSSVDFHGVIGKSPSLLTVLHHLQIVAPTDTTVLVLGESGTGKERIADLLHQFSPRKNKNLIKVNCAALPATLIESELFGHERGAFTGAIERRIGKFEQAAGGTIFLDEIGEMPLDLQVKLLRVLQEKEIERVGGKGAIKIDVRVIAATNRNLEKEVSEGRFRIDLYYRLNVFPLLLPPLRERKEDIPLLANHFIQRFGNAYGKKMEGITDTALNALLQYSWPGNIRELEHCIERSVLLSKESRLNHIALPLELFKETTSPKEAQPIKTMEENERDHILAALKQSKGKISGQGGAAELLGINVSTLNSKMKKLGIVQKTIFS